MYEVRVSCPGQGQVPGSPWELKVYYYFYSLLYSLSHLEVCLLNDVL